MNLLSQIIVGFIAVLHIYILWLEMFAWTTRAKKVFKTIPEDQFEKTKVMAANQGLYNGFLAAGLIWSLLICDATWSKNVALFFLGCVLVAGIYGALTASKRIFFVQAVPAILGILSLVNFTNDIQKVEIISNKGQAVIYKSKITDDFNKIRNNSDRIIIQQYKLNKPNVLENLSNIIWKKTITNENEILEFNSLFDTVKNGGYCCCYKTNYTVTFYKKKQELQTYNIDNVSIKDKILLFDRSNQSSYEIKIKEWESYLSKI
jgi:putative membrane protein